MEGATRHSLRKNRLEKVTPAGVAADGKAQLLEAPSSSGSFVRGIKIGKAANRVGTLTPTNSRGFQRWSFWHQKSMVLFGGSKVQFFLFSVDIFFATLKGKTRVALGIENVYIADLRRKKRQAHISSKTVEKPG